MKLRDYMSGGPSSGTKALQALIDSYGEMFHAVGLYLVFADQIDQNRIIAAKALMAAYDEQSDDYQRCQDVVENKKDSARKRVSELASYNNRTMYQNGYNGFATYLSDVLKIVFSSRPEALRTNDQVRYKEIVGYESKDEILSYLVDKKINELSFLGIDKLNEDMTSKLNFPLFTTQMRSKTIRKISEKRNVLVHNHGRASSRYLQLSGDHHAKLGEKVFLQNGTTLLLYLLRVASEIDSRAVAHFKLEQQELKHG